MTVKQLSEILAIVNPEATVVYEIQHGELVDIISVSVDFLPDSPVLLVLK